MKGRCSCPGVFCKKGVLKNFPKCTGKDLSRSLFYRVTDLQPRTLSNSGICVFIRTSQKFLGQVFQLLEERWNLLQTVPIAITNNNSKLSKAVYILCFLRSTLGRFQRRTQNLDEQLWWSFLRKQLMAEYVLLQKAPSQLFDWILYTRLDSQLFPRKLLTKVFLVL